jgi:hypothetical protein
MFTLTPTSELEAVNYLLEAIEEERVNTLEDAEDPDVISAQNMLSTVSRALQAQGWDFNTETDYPLTPSATGTITLASNISKVTLSDRKVLVRNRTLYDRDNRTYTFDGEQTAEVVFIYPFEELPEVARNYIVLDAGYRFQTLRAPDQLVAQITSGSVKSAFADLVAEDIRDRSPSFPRSSTIANRTR